MKQVLIKKGHVLVEDVPAPTVNKNSVLVEVSYSLISTGTELAGIISSGESILQKAMKGPENVKEALNMMKNQGISQTVAKVRSQLDVARPMGYSCSGVIIEVGEGIQDLRTGDRVACAGAGRANHAEIVCVPRNLVVKVPDNLGLRDAASVTLGAIAVQGVRRADSRFGDIIAVIGLGLIGQITAQILKAAGCHVIGMDISKSRVELAKSLGMSYAIASREENPVDAVIRYSSGYGADATIITAATKSDLPIKQAMEMTRKKGKVVVVGDVGLHLKRKPFYEKELDFLISTSYGPGRYDELYEDKGIDYPYAYVRWTENRNMQEYLRMLAEGKIDFKPLISKEYPIEETQKAYKELTEGKDKSLGVLLKYREGPKTEGLTVKLERKVVVGSRVRDRRSRIKTINVAVIGAGNFAKSVHLPNLKKLSHLYTIYALASDSSVNAKETAKRFGANYCTTDYQEVLRDENVDMILICTRHNLHAQMTIDALKAGKVVFVEKPLALNNGELNEIIKTYNEIYNSPIPDSRFPFPILSVGFNRRFSPTAVRAKEIISKRVSPLIINYRVNAGYIPLDHWVHSEEGGGRIIGEACHMLDLCNYFTDSEVESIFTNSIDPKNTTNVITYRDNFITTLKYKDSSICTLTYTALGAKELGKEYVELYTDGKTLVVDDFRTLRVFGTKAKGIKSKVIQKGHLRELIDFAKCVRGESSLPISMDQLISATETSFIVNKQIAGK